MQITISPKTAEFVNFLTQTGRVSSPEAAVEEAFRLFEEKDPWFNDLREKIEEGTKAIKDGQFSTFDEVSLKVFFQEIMVEGRQKLAKKLALTNS